MVEGVQPAIPENPPLMTLSDQRGDIEALAVEIPRASETTPQMKEVSFDKKAKKKEDSSATSNLSKLKPLQAHVLDSQRVVNV